MSEAKHTPTPELMAQIAAQCKVVAHLASELGKVHSDYARFYSDEKMNHAMAHIAEIVGPRSASFMEQLGNMLNAMDAAGEDDGWAYPIFREAQRLWPVNSYASSQAEIAALRDALKLLSDEAEAADTLGYGWPKARAAALAALSVQQ